MARAHRAHTKDHRERARITNGIAIRFRHVCLLARSPPVHESAP
jgi:hypothetical protein